MNIIKNKNKKCRDTVVTIEMKGLEHLEKALEKMDEIKKDHPNVKSVYIEVK